MSSIYNAHIKTMEQTLSGIVVVWLDVIDDFAYLHHPGQYLQLKLDQEWSFFSIASLPCAQSPLELHIQTNDLNKIQFLLDAFDDQRIIEIKYPFGVAPWKSTLPEALFLSRGTGFAPVKAIIDAAFNQNSGQKIHLCWEGETSQDLYFLPWLFQRLAEHTTFSVSIYTGDTDQSLRESRARLVYKVGSISDDLGVTQDSSIAVNAHTMWCYLCASPARVYQWVDALSLHQIPISHMSSDVFEYAPRQ